MVVCDFCGTAAPTAGESDRSDSRGTPDDHGIPLTWVTSVENGQRRVYCEQCSRKHLRSIESKLDAEWW